MNRLNKIYHSKWFPRFFYTKPDGGKDSGVTGYFLIEWKILISIGILHFKKGTREAYHNHAFNALTWWLSGKVIEHKLNASFWGDQTLINKFEDISTEYSPSLIPKYTSRENFHKVEAIKETYALTIRGPWINIWQEFKENRLINLTHGRKEV